MALTYSRSALCNVLSSTFLTKPLNLTLWRTLTEIGISRARPTRRGCRAGQRKRRRITGIGTSTIEGRILESRASQQVNSTQGRFIPAERYGDLENGGHLHIPSWDELNIHLDTFRSSNENNPLLLTGPLPWLMIVELNH